ncbi:Crp/Fnr family transcriptional regulator [Burkholderia ubonensis]|nr:Crp/Fnr family transcriptional regulator [Burkholderia ubonensis]KVT53815.1 Crp/Fnr family transcriptional regulator [Burkholderia ubonensis]
MRVFLDNPWFSSLPGAEADALLNAATSLRLARGKFLFRQGDRFNASRDAFWGIASGMIKFCVNHQNGSEAILTIFEPGIWFGETALLCRGPRPATAVALTDCELLAVSAARFDTLMEGGAFARAIAALEAKRLELTFGSLADIALQSTRERIARRLVRLAHGDVAQSNAGRRVVDICQDSIAMMLGISRTTLNKELRGLAKIGAIELRYGRIEIKDPALLIAVAEGS